MTVALCLAAACVAYAAGSAAVCVLVNRDDKPAGMPALVHAACRALRAAGQAALRRTIGARPTTHRTTSTKETARA